MWLFSEGERISVSTLVVPTASHVCGEPTEKST